MSSIERYYKSTVEEYVERRRSHLERLRDEGIFTQQEVGKELEDFQRGVEKEFAPNKIYGMLVMDTVYNSQYRDGFTIRWD